MKIFALLLLGAVIVVESRPQKETPEIVLYESDGDDNSYNFKYETSDGIARVEKGEQKPNSKSGEDSVLSVEGSYVYTDNEGKQHRVHYRADENGFVVLPN